MSTTSPAPAWRKFLIELGPLLVFFGVFKFYGFMWATGAFMVAMAEAQLPDPPGESC